ncbi:MAG: methionyl-tRNA formyltransferase [Balneolaceae bacterium]
MRIIFMGSPDFAVPSLKKLADSGHEIIAVVSNPDKRRVRGGGKKPTAVKQAAMNLKLTVIDAEDLNSEAFRQQIASLNPDLLVVVAFRILPKSILDIPKKGSVNLHASLLPKYRGAAPIHHAIMNGETETGCTVFFIDEKVDTGKIIGQVSTEIGPNETTGDLYERLKIIGSELLVESVDKIESGNINPVKQNEAEVTPAPKLFKNDTKINLGESSQAVHNKIRGLSPSPTAWCYYNGQKMNIYLSETGPDLDLEQGELKFIDQKLLAGCGSGTVQLVEIQLPGTKRMSGSEFVNGYELKRLS